MRQLALILMLVATAAPAQAQLFRRPPPPPAALPPAPPPDPKAWWEDKVPEPPEAANPLGGRRLGSHEQPIPVNNGVDPSTYRLWGLIPLQWQLLRRQEMIVEVWVRPARSVRQSVVRVTVRRDGKGFVQARAGLACCEAEIARRLGFDAELTPAQVQGFLALPGHPMWSAPRDVQVIQSADTVAEICVDGTSYDLTLVVPGRSRSLRRACDTPAVGQVAEALEPTLAAALGHDPRFDVIFPGGVSFAVAREAYRDLVAHGGALKADTRNRPQPPAVPIPADEPAVTPPTEPPAPGPSPP